VRVLRLAGFEQLERRWHEVDRQQLHAADRAPARLDAHDLRVHRAREPGRAFGALVDLWLPYVHLGDQGEDPVGLAGEVDLEAGALGLEVRVRTERLEGGRRG
jgi:hypothetical protein